jgi:hypothetical protein
LRFPVTDPHRRSEALVQTNPLLPVLRILSPNHHWPGVVNDAFPRVMASSIDHHLFLTREHVTAAGGLDHDDRPEVRLMRLASTAGADARRIMCAAHLATSDIIGTRMLDAVTATRMWHLARPLPRPHGVHHDKTVLNQALACAEWIGAADRSTAPTFDESMRVVGDRLSSMWTWIRHNTEQTAYEFSLTRTLPGALHFEQIVVTSGVDDQLAIAHRRSDMPGTHTSLTWTELCYHMACAYVSAAPAGQHDTL